jgi:CDP-diacylglycerol--glycerol-3-phosphate 3-phosphatidyltransferase
MGVVIKILLNLLERQVRFTFAVDFSLRNVILSFEILLQNDPPPKMIGNKIGHQLDPYLSHLVKNILGKHTNPNFFTFSGFLATLVASILILKGFWLLAGLAIILSGLFDLFDGVAARELGKVTAFGGFLDSVLDRYSDLLLLLALLFDGAKKGDVGFVLLASFASMGTVLIPYVRAKAEALQIPCTVGLMERAERIILLSIGTLFQWMEPILWILVILTHFTVLQRIYYVWKRLRAPLESENSKSKIPNPG